MIVRPDFVGGNVSLKDRQIEMMNDDLKATGDLIDHEHSRLQTSDICAKYESDQVFVGETLEMIPDQM
ncbi:MAG TPA: hypothetical protein VK762_22890 [Polyangiaceae bacterium]|nr:hypothetical protein [Polyangiaceae bacterium]